MNQDFKVPDGKLDSREIAKQMGCQHERLMQTIKKYHNQLEREGPTKECAIEDNNGSSVVFTKQEVK